MLLLAPTLVLGTLISHSSPQNLTWASQFAEQVRAGVLYPRWMPNSFDGLGSPAFYFYPPLPFWIDALVSVVTANGLSVPHRLAATTTVILFLSGIAMHAWLLKASGKRKAALVGAIAYMAAPYILFDILHAWRLRRDHRLRGSAGRDAGSPPRHRKGAMGPAAAGGGLRSAAAVASADGALVLDHGDPGLRALRHALTRTAAALCRRRRTGDRARGDLPVAGDRAAALDLERRALDLVLPRQQLVRDGARALGRSRHHARDRLDRAGGGLAGRGPVLCPAAAPRRPGAARAGLLGGTGPRLPDPDRGAPAVVLGPAAGRQGAVPLAAADGRRVRLADRALPGAARRASPHRRLCLRAPRASPWCRARS